MTGLQLVKMLHASQNHIPVMLMSGFLTEDVISTAVELGVDDITEKPPSLENLVAFIERTAG